MVFWMDDNYLPDKYSQIITIFAGNISLTKNTL